LLGKQNYESETRDAYRSSAIAQKYKTQHMKALTWARLTMLMESKSVEKAIRRCALNKNSIILDIPCGTGILGHLLSKFPSSIFAGDISLEMIEQARTEYHKNNFKDFLQLDLTQLPLKKNVVDCVIVLGFMHRVPPNIRVKSLREIANVAVRFLIVSYSYDSFAQRAKHRLIKKIRPTHRSAPFPTPMKKIYKEFQENGFIVKKKFTVVFFLSTEVIFLLEKKKTLRTN